MRKKHGGGDCAAWGEWGPLQELVPGEAVKCSLTLLPLNCGLHESFVFVLEEGARYGIVGVVGFVTVAGEFYQ